MADLSGEIMQATWGEHPAVAAWHELRPDLAANTRLEMLEGSSPPTSIYRLVNIAKAGPAVIAKRCRQEKALIERSVYEEILPNLPLPMLQYYGYVEESNGEFCWLFLEDVSLEKYDPRSERQRVAAGRWLGQMNIAAANLSAASRLPWRGPEHYLALLQSARDIISSNCGNPALNDADLTVLKTVFARCDHLSTHWGQLAAACEAMPQTLVHGDFIGKNVGIRTAGDGITFLPFDWENAGWGVPAEDISEVDITTYWLTIKEHWPELTIHSLKRLAYVGRIFRCLVFLHWIAPNLARESVEQPMSDLMQCENWLAILIQKGGWRA